jgi:molybdopterin synthase catalytic subunit
VDLIIKLMPDRLDGAMVYAQFCNDHKNSGAIVSFSGRVRTHNDKGQVDHLYLDWYPAMTELSLKSIGQAAMTRFDINAALIAHRCGKVEAEDEIVCVITAAAHRRSAFEAADYLMDRLKSEAAFWKREVGQNFSDWIDPTEKDRTDLNRWLS